MEKEEEGKGTYFLTIRGTDTKDSTLIVTFVLRY